MRILLLSKAMSNNKKTHLGMARACLNGGVVLISSGLKRGLLLYLLDKQRYLL